jgi:hypothetical protein
VRKCHDNFDGTCPAGKVRREEHDWHNCRDNCQSPDECCVDAPAYCRDWSGTCPAGSEPRHDDDLHHCSNGQCSEDECCAHSCDGLFTCETGFTKKEDYYGPATVAKERCCVKTCFDNFKGTCPAGREVRHETDEHSCIIDGVDNCQSPEQCCVGFCKSNFHGTCPTGKIKMDNEHCDTPWDPNKCNADRCCQDPPLCDPNTGAPAGTTHTCMHEPQSCEEVVQSICNGGCYHECFKQATNPSFFDQYLQAMQCSGTAATICSSPTSKCKGGLCCGTGTKYVQGKCIATASGAIEACKFGRGRWGESTCQQSKNCD